MCIRLHPTIVHFKSYVQNLVSSGPLFLLFFFPFFFFNEVSKLKETEVAVSERLLFELYDLFGDDDFWL